jgi:hypothetical protein
VHPRPSQHPAVRTAVNYACSDFTGKLPKRAALALKIM